MQYFYALDNETGWREQSLTTAIEMAFLQAGEGLGEVAFRRPLATV